MTVLCHKAYVKGRNRESETTTRRWQAECMHRSILTGRTQIGESRCTCPGSTPTHQAGGTHPQSSHTYAELIALFMFEQAISCMKCALYLAVALGAVVEHKPSFSF